MPLAGKKNNPTSPQSLTDDTSLPYFKCECTVFNRFPSQNFLASWKT